MAMLAYHRKLCLHLEKGQDSRLESLVPSLMRLQRKTEAVSTKTTIPSCMLYLTIIPQARVGYEMIDSQRGA